jgi:phage regulator Rha-like protein
MIEIVTQNEVLVIDSRLIAEGLGIQHKNLLETITKHLQRLERKSPVAFKTDVVKRPQGGTYEVSYCFLTEYQATLLMTFSRNTDKVLDCKERLVTAFDDARSGISKPKTALQLAKEQVVLLESIERLEAEKHLLEEQNHQLSEAVDELFDYSSIIRIAKFNNVPETNFKWQTLKAMSVKMGIEVKRVPCPRFEYKNLYSHDVWRYTYPNIKLPETTTLVIHG